MITVAVVDDEVLLRSGLASLIEARRRHDRGRARPATARRACRLAQQLQPDVVLMDIRMPEMDGLEATRRIVEDPSDASTRVLILTTFDHDEYVYEALRVGASGFLLKAAMPDELRNAVRVIASGEGLLAPSVTRRLIEDFAARPSVAVPGPRRAARRSPTGSATCWPRSPTGCRTPRSAPRCT